MTTTARLARTTTKTTVVLLSGSSRKHIKRGGNRRRRRPLFVGVVKNATRRHDEGHAPRAEEEDEDDEEEKLFVRRLNEQFSIAKSVSFEKEDEGRKSAPFASLTHENGSSAKVYLFGANCASWKQPSGDEVLFVRPDAKWDETVPIAGKHYFLCAIGFLCRLI